jgi:hypothetical protein
MCCSLSHGPRRQPLHRNPLRSVLVKITLTTSPQLDAWLCNCMAAVDAMPQLCELGDRSVS